MNRKIYTIISLAVMMFLLGTWAATAQVFPVSADFLDDIGISSFLPIMFKGETAVSTVIVTVIVYTEIVPLITATWGPSPTPTATWGPSPTPAATMGPPVTPTPITGTPPPAITEPAATSPAIEITPTPLPVIPLMSTGALYVFSTTATTTGNPGGRSGMNAFCSAEDIHSHFCNTEELVKAFTSSGVYFSDPFNEAWVDNVIASKPLDWAGKYTCNGWTYTSSHERGRTVEDEAKMPSVRSCNSNLPVACCKWIP